MTSFQKQREIQVLLGCARTRMHSDGASAVISALYDGIDWDYLLTQAFYHGIAPLLFHHLSRICPAKIPEKVFNQLKSAVNLLACSNLGLTGELIKLLTRLRNIGIRALPFKGPVLVAAAYGDLSLRSFGDLDILVPKEDIIGAKEVLLHEGYTPVLRLSPAEERLYVQTHHDYQFTRARDTMIVEIQWGITQWSFTFPTNFDELWRRREEIQLAGAAIPTLATEDLLLWLCVHGAKHRWEQLKWICDIAELVASHETAICWEPLLFRARALGGERMLVLGFFLAHEILGAKLSPQVFSVIQKQPKVKILADRVRSRLFRDISRPDDLFNERPFFYWHMRERLRDKLAIVRRYSPEYLSRMLLPNARDHAFLELPESLSLGYYLVRPLRVIRDYLAHTCGRSST